MVVNMISSGFLLLVLVAGVQSLAPMDLGEACTVATDICVHPTLGVVCDTLGTAGICRVKAGQACDAAGGLCVNGALCVSNNCTCQTAGGYTQDSATGKCNAPSKKWGATCTTGQASDCTGTNAQACIAAAGACACTGVTYAVNYATGNCDTIATAAKVGTDCSAGACSGTGMSCVSATCKCNAGYYAIQTGGDCRANAANYKGIECTSNAAACGTQATTFAVCPALGSPKYCECQSNYRAVDGGKCYPEKKKLGGGCSVDSDCTGGPTKCTSYESAPNTCKTALALSADCTVNTDTTACGNNLVCNGTCKTALAAGTACTDNHATTACADGLVCNNATCKTKVTTAGGSCAAATTVCGTGFICDATLCKTVLSKDGNCSVANTKCDTGLTCVATKCIQSNANTVTITAFLVMAVAAVGKLMM